MAVGPRRPIRSREGRGVDLTSSAMGTGLKGLGEQQANFSVNGRDRPSVRPKMLWSAQSRIRRREPVRKVRFASDAADRSHTWNFHLGSTDPYRRDQRIDRCLRLAAVAQGRGADLDRADHAFLGIVSSESCLHSAVRVLDGFSPEHTFYGLRFLLLASPAQPRAFVADLLESAHPLGGGSDRRATHWASSKSARPDIRKAVQTNGDGVTHNAEGGEAMNTLRLSASVGR